MKATSTVPALVRRQQRQSGGHRLAYRALIALAVLALAAITAPAAALATSTGVPQQDISSAGPLTDIFLGNDLSCQVAYSGDSSYEFYPPGENPGDCGTLMFTGGTLYAPDFAADPETATLNIGTYTAWTPVSQSAVTGAGTTSSPYTVTTVDSAGTTGLTLTEVDSYVVGQDTYRTDVTIANSTGSAQSGILYRAGDCYLQGSDYGYGEVTGGNAPACTVNANNSPPARIEQWVPITAGSSYVEDWYYNVWSDIGAHTAFPDTCQCSTLVDNGGGLSWNFTVPANGSVTYSQLTAFSPTGNLPLTTAKTADSSSVAAGGQDGYTITISNPNAAAVTLVDFTDTLPAGFSYVPGSTTGATTSDPTISGQSLTWSGTFAVSGNSSVSLHFDVTAPSSPGGPFYDNAGGDASGGYTVTPTGPTAPVTVTGSTSTSVTCSQGQSCQTDITTAVSALQVTAGAGPQSTLSENVDQGTPLVCEGYTPVDPNWFAFFSTSADRSKTLVYTLLNTVRDTAMFCFGAPYDFLTNKGKLAPPHKLPDGSPGFVGLLPNCPVKRPGPCVASKKQVVDPNSTTGYATVTTVTIPRGLPGDPIGRM